MNHAVIVPAVVELMTSDAEVLAVSNEMTDGFLLEITIPVSPDTPLRVRTPLNDGFAIGLAAFGGKRTTDVEPDGIVTVVAPLIRVTETV